MTPILQEITTLNWWLSVVVVGITINLISGPIGRILSNSISAISGKWRTRTEKKKETELRLVQELVDCIAKIEGERDRAIRKFGYGLLVLMISIAILSFEISDAFMYILDRKTWVFLNHGTPRGFFGALLIMASVSEVSGAISIYDRILRARKQIGQLLQMPALGRIERFFGTRDRD